MKTNTYDFCGWATRNNVRCSDGRTIMKDAFKHNDGQIVPLVWNHQHNEPTNVLGHALLENRNEGVYAYCTFNDTEYGQHAKELVMHKDITQLSIYANQLKQSGGNVLHGAIREVSLVYAGANPEAYIESIIRHSADGEEFVNDDEGVIYTGENFTLHHADEQKEEPEMAETTNNTNTSDKTVKEVWDGLMKKLSDEEQKVVYAIIGEAVDGSASKKNNEEDNKDSEGGDNMKHNVFDQGELDNGTALSHSDMMAVIDDAKRYGSMKESALAHGMENLDILFPDAHNVSKAPTIISGDLTWVQKVMKGVHHTPFSKIKALFADITADEARARGYIKGKQKKEEVFALLKRTTSPQTVYKLQKMDRDDIIDITDFDVVAFLKGEMRTKLDEELARAVLIGDGRLADAEEKIKEEHIRPIWTDEELYAIHSIVNVPTDATMAEIAEEFIDQAVRAREDYDGSGSPKAYIAENLLSACLLLKDKMGRRLYKDMNELATAMMVSEIVTVPPMKGASRVDAQGKTRNLLGIIVNLTDYTMGADKGGAVNLFDDFDIDFNKYTYLIETRCSGSLMKPKSGIVLEMFAGEGAE